MVSNVEPSFGKWTRGVSTLELLIAFAILLLAITAIIMVIFSNQSIAIDTQTNIEALTKAQRKLEMARANSREDFNSVVTGTEVSLSGIPYTETLTVADLTECKKQATSTVSWSEGGRTLTVDLATFFTDIAGFFALGGDCAIDPPSDGWGYPTERGFLHITPGGSATDIDVEYKTAFITLSDTPAMRADLAIIDVTSSTTPQEIITIDFNSSPGFNAIDVATSTNGHLYAYIARNATSSQLLVIDITNSAAPALTASSTLPNMTKGVARSIYYYDEKIYIGTQRLACVGCPTYQNNELHIFDVSDPTGPVWEESIKVDRNVNAISVRDDLAYLAVGSGSDGIRNPFKIFDVNPSSITYTEQIGSFIGAGDEDGMSVFLLGTKTYLGLQRAPSSRPDFYVLNISDLSSITAIASVNLALNPNTQVSGVRVAGGVIFLGTTDPNSGFQVRHVSGTSVPLVVVPNSSFNFQQNTTGIDFADNTIYLSSSSGSRTLEIVGPGP